MTELHIFKVGIMSNTHLIEAPSAEAAAFHYRFFCMNGNVQLGAVVYEMDGEEYRGDKTPWLAWMLDPDADRAVLDIAMKHITPQLKRCREVGKTVCLCGSTRFHEAYVEANYQETMAGNIVLSCGVFGHSIHCDRPLTATEKVRLDRLHYKKIDMADEILVLNVGGYIGKSTRQEIEYAESRGLPVRYWEDKS